MQSSRTTSWTTIGTRSQTRFVSTERVTDRVAPETTLVTLTVSVAVPPATVRVPPTSRLWPIILSVDGSCPGFVKTCSARRTWSFSRSTTLPPHADSRGGRMSLISMSAKPLRSARNSSGPETEKCWTQTAGYFTLTNAARACGRLRLRMETGTFLRLPLRIATFPVRRSTPGLPRNGVVAANIQ